MQLLHIRTTENLATPAAIVKERMKSGEGFFYRNYTSVLPLGLFMQQNNSWNSEVHFYPAGKY